MTWIETVREWMNRENSEQPPIQPAGAKPRSPEGVVGDMVTVSGTSFYINGGKRGWKLEKLGRPEVPFRETGAVSMQQITEPDVPHDTLVKGGRILVLPRPSWHDAGGRVAKR